MFDRPFRPQNNPMAEKRSKIRAKTVLSPNLTKSPKNFLLRNPE